MNNTDEYSARQLRNAIYEWAMQFLPTHFLKSKFSAPHFHQHLSLDYDHKTFTHHRPRPEIHLIKLLGAYG